MPRISREFGRVGGGLLINPKWPQGVPRNQPINPHAEWRVSSHEALSADSEWPAGRRPRPTPGIKMQSGQPINPHAEGISSDIPEVLIGWTEITRAPTPGVASSGGGAAGQNQGRGPAELGAPAVRAAGGEAPG